MSKPADRRILGLSPRARRVVVPFVVIAAVIVVIAYFSSGRSAESADAGTVVGADSPAGGPGQGILDGGQVGAGHRAGTTRWTQPSSLEDMNIIGSSSTGLETQAAGHARGPRR